VTVKIKNCGLKTLQVLQAAAAHGASYVGFVHHVASPRHLELDSIAELARTAPASLKHVVVLVDPSDALLDELQRHFRPHYLQIHNVTDPKRIAAIGARTGIPVITAISVRSSEDLANIAALETVSAHLLFDGKESGSGEAFNWNLVSGLKLKKAWFLAGGLTADNVAEAIAITGAPMVDVSSGIESAPGIKSLEKIAAFNAAVLAKGLSFPS
jgi:phosphoribosylanthranilate isomerase